MTRTTNTFRYRTLAVIFNTALLLVSTASMAGCPTYIRVTQNPPVVCANTPVTMTATTDGTGGSFFWETNDSKTSVATYVPGNNTPKMIVEYGRPGQSCRLLDTFSINVNPAPQACAGPNGILTDRQCTVNIGGSPTGRSGRGHLSYLWSTGDTVANPLVTITGTSTYTVTVSDVNSCTSKASVIFQTGSYIELLAGRDASSEGRVVSDMIMGSGGELYACGWADKDVYTHNNIQQKNLLLATNQSRFFFISKYNPRSVYPYIWGTQIATQSNNTNAANYPTHSGGEGAHPFTPSMAQVSSAIFITSNTNGQGQITKINKTTGAVAYTQQTESLIFTDIKDDGASIYVTGYCTNKCVFNGTLFHRGDIFLAKLDPTLPYLSWRFIKNTILNVFGSDGIPAIALTPTNEILLSTLNLVRFYNSTGITTGMGTYATSINSTSVNNRIIVNSTHNSFYITDGQAIYQYNYTRGLSSVTVGNSISNNNTIYDIKQDSTGAILAVSYNDVQKYDPMLNSNMWSANPRSAYNACTAPTSFATIDAADRCLTIDPATNNIYIGGSHPSQSCALKGIYDFNMNFGFITHVDDNTGNVQRLSHTQSSSNTDQVSGSDINVYPNPVQNTLHINTDASDDQSTYAITSLTGQELMTGSLIKGQDNQINTQSLPTGLYLVQVRSAGKTQTQKLVKE
jgi:hypothetical protein